MARSKGRKPYILVFAVIFVILGWVVTAAFPFVSAWYLAPRKAEDVKKLKGVLEQTGNYGDAFGSINTLFSGIALILVIYTLSLQQRQIRDAEQARKETALVDALSNLCNVYAAIYGADRNACDEEFQNGRATILAPSQTENQGYTVKGKLIHFVGRLETNLDRIKRGEKMDFPSDE